MFIQAMSQLYGGERDSFLVTLKQVIEKYPKDEVTEIAQSIVKGIQEGRSLTDGKYATEVKEVLVEKTRLVASAFEVRVIDEIPKNEAGKILYSKLNV